MDEPLAPGITVGKSKIDGKGCFATTFFPKGRKITEYVGEKVSRREVARRIHKAKRIHICGIDSYWAIDGRVGGNGTQYINHSCDPNCFIRILHGHILFFARRDIYPGEEITVDYISSYHSDQTECHCQSPSCRGTINRLKRRQRSRVND